MKNREEHEDDGVGVPLEPVVVPITDSLDLHTFNPRDLPDLLDEYIRACREKGFLSVRIIHGKGKGILKERVRKLLEKHPHVLSFSSGHLESGGWGATSVELRPVD